MVQPMFLEFRRLLMMGYLANDCMPRVIIAVVAIPGKYDLASAMYAPYSTNTATVAVAMASDIKNTTTNNLEAEKNSLFFLEVGGLPLVGRSPTQSPSKLELLRLEFPSQEELHSLEDAKIQDIPDNSAVTFEMEGENAASCSGSVTSQKVGFSTESLVKEENQESADVSGQPISKNAKSRDSVKENGVDLEILLPPKKPRSFVPTASAAARPPTPPPRWSSLNLYTSEGVDKIVAVSRRRLHPTSLSGREQIYCVPRGQKKMDDVVPRRNKSRLQTQSSIYYDVKRLSREKGPLGRCLYRLCHGVCLRSKRHARRKAVLTFSGAVLLFASVYTIIYFSQLAFIPTFRRSRLNQSKSPPLWAITVISILTVAFGLANAFSIKTRAVTSLMLPALFTSRGRAFIATILLHLLLSGPFFNFLENAQKLPEATKCQASVLANETRVIQRQLYQKFAREYEERAGKMMNQTVRFLHDTFWSFYNNLPGNIHVEISKFEVEFSGLTFNSSDFSDFDNDVFFMVDSSKPKVVSSKPLSEFLRIIRKALEQFITSLKNFLSALFLVLPWTLVLLFIQSFIYHRGYSHRLEYDNHYITERFKALDGERQAQGRKSILPLTFRERSKYVDATSCILARRELSALFVGLLIVIILGIFGVVMFSIDYGFYYLMKVVSDQVNATLTVSGAIDVSPDFRDTSPKVKLLLQKQLHFLKHFNLSYNSTTDTAQCIPVISAPFIYNDTSIIACIALYALMTFITLLQAYGMRLQHRIAGYFYPEKERQRMMYLYQSIEARRFSFARIFFGAYTKNPAIPTLKTWFSVRFPRFSRLLTGLGIMRHKQCDFCAENKIELFAISKYVCCDRCLSMYRDKYHTSDDSDRYWYS